MGEVLVIETKRLFELMNPFQGFEWMPHDLFLLSAIEANAQWLDKEQAESDPTYKQLIGYAAIINLKKEIFLYQRAVQDSQYPEKRLQGKWSIGIGGHVEKSTDSNSILASINREIDEEVHVSDKPRIILLGGINDDSNSVGQVHFGLFLLADIFHTARPKSLEIAHGEMRSIKDIDKLFRSGADVENWSRICFEHIQKL